MTDAAYARAIREKLTDLKKIAQTALDLVKVHRVLAPLEAYCGRDRCLGTNTCPHLRVEVLITVRRPGGETELPYTAVFQPGEDPEPPYLVQGWGL